MTYNICIFDQDGTLYPKNSQLWLELSKRTREWLCKIGKMTESDFQKFKLRFPDFHEGLDFMGLNLQMWQNEVQKWMLQDIDNLLIADNDLAKLIASIENTYVVTFSCELFSERVLEVLWIRNLLSSRFSLDQPLKWEIYKSIQKKHQCQASDILVLWDNYIADLQPAVNLWMEILKIDSELPITQQLSIL